MTPDSDVIILCRRIMTSESGVIICLHSIKTSADLLKRKRFTHGTLCSKSRSNVFSGDDRTFLKMQNAISSGLTFLMTPIFLESDKRLSIS